MAQKSYYKLLNEIGRNDLMDWAIDMDKKGKLEEYKDKKFTPPSL